MNVFEELEGNIFVKDMLGQFPAELDQVEKTEKNRAVENKSEPPKSDPSPGKDSVAIAKLLTPDNILAGNSGTDPDIRPKSEEAPISTEPEETMPRLPKEVCRLDPLTKGIFCRIARSKRATGVTWDEAFRQALQDIKEQDPVQDVFTGRFCAVEQYLKLRSRLPLDRRNGNGLVTMNVFDEVESNTFFHEMLGDLYYVRPIPKEVLEWDFGLQESFCNNALENMVGGMLPEEADRAAIESVKNSDWYTLWQKE
jgi:hypothetical protein